MHRVGLCFEGDADDGVALIGKLIMAGRQCVCGKCVFFWGIPEVFVACQLRFPPNDSDQDFPRRSECLAETKSAASLK